MPYFSIITLKFQNYFSRLDSHISCICLLNTKEYKSWSKVRNWLKQDAC